MIKLWRFKFYISSQWKREEREFTHNDIDWLYFDFSTSNEDIQLNICLAGIGIGIMFTIRKENR